MPLIVTEPFANHARGDRITDPEQIAAILASDHEAFVRRTGSAPAAKDAPKPVDAPPEPDPA